MIKTGLCSASFRQLKVDEIISLATKAQIDAIEWSGNSHVPHGDLDIARRVKKKMAASDLHVAAYGSYFKVGVSKQEGPSYSSVLETAMELGAPTIRLWAGNKDYVKTGAEFIQEIVDETYRIADMAEKQGLTISFEFHSGTLTDSNETAIKFADQVKHDAVWFYWQVIPGRDIEYSLSGLNNLLARLSNVHVFHWTVGSPKKNIFDPANPPKWPDDFYRHNLEKGKEEWTRILKTVNSSCRKHYALLEFFKDDEPTSFLKDADMLRQIVADIQPAFPEI